MPQQGARSQGMVRPQNKHVLAVLWLCRMVSPECAPPLTMQQGHRHSPEVPTGAQVLLRTWKHLTGWCLARTGPASSPVCSSIAPIPEGLCYPSPTASPQLQPGSLGFPACRACAFGVRPCQAQWFAPHCRHGRAQLQDRSSALAEEMLSAAAASGTNSPAQRSPSSPESRITPRQQLLLFYFMLAISSLKEIEGTNFITPSVRQSPAGPPARVPQVGRNTPPKECQPRRELVIAGAPLLRAARLAAGWKGQGDTGGVWGQRPPCAAGGDPAGWSAGGSRAGRAQAAGRCHAGLRFPSVCSQCAIKLLKSCSESPGTRNRAL